MSRESQIQTENKVVQFENLFQTTQINEILQPSLDHTSNSETTTVHLKEKRLDCICTFKII